jgi:hypothetical protein
MATIAPGGGIDQVVFSPDEITETDAMLASIDGDLIVADDGSYINIGGGFEGGDAIINGTWQAGADL